MTEQSQDIRERPEDITSALPSDAIPEFEEGGVFESKPVEIDRKRVGFICLGLALFVGVYLSPCWPAAVDPEGKEFLLCHEGKAALGLFLLTATWWVTEAIPIGVTSWMVGVIQTMFLIRGPKQAFGDFLDPSVVFIFGSLIIGIVFTKTGLTKRLAYKMLSVVGERTVMIYLGCFVITAGLTLVMAHTAVAATIFPLLMAVHSLYDEEQGVTKFGKGLFIGMAFTAGAGSIITLLGAARGAVAIEFYKEIVNKEISFFGLTYYMLPVGVVMVLLLWVFFVFYFPPERKTIPGLRDRAKTLYASLGPITRPEITSVVIVLLVIITLGARSFIDPNPPGDPGWYERLNKSAVLLAATILFFLLKILDLRDLENVSWNIILLFGGAMSIGFCLFQTGAAQWLAVQWLVLFKLAPQFVFIMAVAFFVLIMTNVIMNVAAIAISIPVGIVLGGYLNVAPEVILFSALVTAGMPFLLLVGAAPNAIAYGSRQFESKEFFMAGIPASILLMVVLAIFVWLIWPWMGMPMVIN
jgi:sodium-dependent dicarboxylate transporter 2/3/5